MGVVVAAVAAFVGVVSTSLVAAQQQRRIPSPLGVVVAIVVIVGAAGIALLTVEDRWIYALLGFFAGAAAGAVRLKRPAK